MFDVPAIECIKLVRQIALYSDGCENLQALTAELLSELNDQPLEKASVVEKIGGLIYTASSVISGLKENDYQQALEEAHNQLRIMHFKISINCFHSQHKKGNNSATIDIESQVVQYESFKLKWNRSNITDYSVSFDEDFVVHSLLKNVESYPTDIIETGLDYLSECNIVFAIPFFLRPKLLLSKEWLSLYIESCLTHYKCYASYSTVRAKLLSKEDCQIHASETLVYAYIVAQKGVQLYPDDEIMRQALEKITFVAKMHNLAIDGKRVSVIDYEEAKAPYDNPLNVPTGQRKLNAQNLREFDASVKNFSFYNKFMQLFDFTDSRTKLEVEDLLLRLFEPLETALEESLGTDSPEARALSALAIPDNYFAFGGCNFPVAPDDYKKISKKSALRVVLENIFVEKGLLPRGVFARFLSFVDKDIANKVVQEGNVFLEHADYMSVNLHGKFSHALQIYLMFKLIEAGLLTVPRGSSLQELVTDLTVSKNRENEVIWIGLLDSATLNYLSPYALNTFLLGNRNFKKNCPILAGYLLDSYCSHQCNSREIFVRSNGLVKEFSNLQLITMFAVAYRFIITPRCMDTDNYVPKSKTSSVLSYYSSGSKQVYFKNEKYPPKLDEPQSYFSLCTIQ